MDNFFEKWFPRLAIGTFVLVAISFITTFIFLFWAMIQIPELISYVLEAMATAK